jgi:hypothetical protein
MDSQKSDAVQNVFISVFKYASSCSLLLVSVSFEAVVLSSDHYVSSTLRPTAIYWFQEESFVTNSLFSGVIVSRLTYQSLPIAHFFAPVLEVVDDKSSITLSQTIIALVTLLMHTKLQNID